MTASTRDAFGEPATGPSDSDVGLAEEILEDAIVDRIADSDEATALLGELRALVEKIKEKK